MRRTRFTEAQPKHPNGGGLDFGYVPLALVALAYPTVMSPMGGAVLAIVGGTAALAMVIGSRSVKERGSRPAIIAVVLAMLFPAWLLALAI